MCSFSNKLCTEYFTEHGDQPVPITVDLFDWAVDKFFILHEQLYRKDEMAESIAHVLHQCYELAADSATVSTQHMTEELELITLSSMPDVTTCPAIDEHGSSNCCPNDMAHAHWKESRIKVAPKGQANTCIVLPLTNT
ncbi:uncharacterized protein UHOR_16740 [Ustilago hordei]|uniref:Uncharacterized protein n=1 Tax=Ustilago hordei TaxID=120017 RepID=I2G6V8_USTHO|nr:hypothetical protein NDA12_003043 [Ustilago hordei]KAJ1589167.1 hypothetical protein NDA15_003023 [Ustilago hordei]CCF54901.1 uncharacterized protein UHOR_16740 [Ustilago hordei]